MTSVFMTYAAVLPVLRTQWGMSATAAGSISTGFQLGYAVALVAFSAMADRVGARRLFLGSGWLSAVTAIAFGLWARSCLTGLALSTLMALSQGGTYTAAIMLIADRYFAALGGGLLAAYCAWGLAPGRLTAVRAKAPSR
jgi:sugar phosphate permease